MESLGGFNVLECIVVPGTLGHLQQMLWSLTLLKVLFYPCVAKPKEEMNYGCMEVYSSGAKSTGLD